MPSQRQEEFIRLNPSLSPEQLSQQTGLRLHQVHKLLKRLAAETQGPAPPLPKKALWGWAFIPVIATLLFYLPVLGNGFTNWDDPKYILSNPDIRSLDASFFKWSWTTFYMGNWMPLTWWSFALDYAAGGLNPLVYHLDNLFWHLLNTLLVFFISFKVLSLAEGGGPGGQGRTRTGALSAAVLTAALFGIHPLHVESVAWAAEKKDVLCGFFFLLSLSFYLDDASRSGRKRWAWGASFISYALALMAKPMALSLPFVFLLLDLWPLKRTKAGSVRIWMEKIPFLILFLVECWIAPLAQSGNHAPHDQTPAFRVMNAFHSVVFYLWKMVFPSDLCPFYPVGANPAAFSGMNLFSCILVFGISIWCWRERKKWPFLGIAWLYFGITLLPVLGLTQIGFQAAADRYTYLPSLGPFLLISAVAADKLRGLRTIFLTAAILLIGLLGILTLQQLAVWKSSLALWEYEMKTCPIDSAVPHQKLGETYLELGRTQEALAELDKALALAPNNDEIHITKGVLLRQEGDWAPAADEFQKAIALNPANALAYCNLGMVDINLGLKDQAVSEADQAIQLDPPFALAYVVLGIVDSNQKDYQKAREDFQNAVKFDPLNPDWAQNLASVNLDLGRLNDAVSWYQKAIRLNPNNPVCFLNLGMIYAREGQSIQAREELEYAAQLGPKDPGFYEQLSRIYLLNHQPDEAASCSEKARELREGGFR